MSTMTEELTYCEVHPDRETALRCNKCGRLMCADCAVSTPVGYRCKQCVRQHENKFFNASSNDYTILFGVCAALSGVGGFLASAIGGFILLWVIGSIPAGGFISEAALRATKRRRGRYSGEIGAAGVVLGGLVGGLLHSYSTYSAYLSQAATQIPEELAGRLPGPSLEFLIQSTLPNIGMWIFIGVVAAFVYQRFRLR
jgi:MFS family permease